MTEFEASWSVTGHSLGTVVLLEKLRPRQTVQRSEDGQRQQGQLFCFPLRLRPCSYRSILLQEDGGGGMSSSLVTSCLRDQSRDVKKPPKG